MLITAPSDMNKGEIEATPKIIKKVKNQCQCSSSTEIFPQQVAPGNTFILCELKDHKS